ncbi:MAG: alpha/beta fold hydrolase [Xanthomonadales bacterium]|nr:alpha/beta fold hydrolase [Xanthomonadales bacterium]
MFRLNALLVLIAFVSTALADAGTPQQQFADIGDVKLVSGDTLHDVRMAYVTAGTLNETRSNVIVFPSWFTGTARQLFDLGKIGPGKLADTNRYYVIAVDSLGNGVSTSPSNAAEQGGTGFPAIAIDDMVTATHALLSQELGFERVHAVMGISMGGMQTFQWIAQYPGFMQKAVAIDGSPRLATYDLAVWQVHVDAIELLGAAGVSGEETMRFLGSLGLLALWTPDYFVENVPRENWPEFRAGFRESMVQMHPSDVRSQLEAMIAHDVYADFTGAGNDYIDRVQAELLVVGVEGDHMVNPVPARRLADELGAQYAGIESNCGHLGTSCEEAIVTAIVNEFLESGRKQ